MTLNTHHKAGVKSKDRWLYHEWRFVWVHSSEQGRKAASGKCLVLCSSKLMHVYSYLLIIGLHVWLIKRSI
jgi:hypothetical protein